MNVRGALRLLLIGSAVAVLAPAEFLAPAKSFAETNFAETKGFAATPGSAPTASFALTGRVTSVQEGAMEGVLVSARRDGSPLTVTVVTDKTGRYGFPSERLAPGHYALQIRAVGYELTAPAGADVVPERPASADLALTKIEDVSGQLTSTEWFISMPGTAEQKRPLIECMSCHTLERVVRSKFTADEFVGVLKRMSNYANNSTTQHPQPRMVERPVPDDRARKVAEYLATVNLSKAEPLGLRAQGTAPPDRPCDPGDRHRIRHAAIDDRAP